MREGGNPVPRIAVLITYHNEGPLLTECIESVARQNEAPDEILVYDDASTVRPEPFIPPDVPVKLIRGDVNHGPAHGRNVMLAATTCEFIHFHDADDMFADGWASGVRAALRERDVDVVLTDLIAMREGVVVSDRTMALVDRLSADPDLVRFGLRGALLLPSSTTRRSVALALGGFRTRQAMAQSEDFDFHIRLGALIGNRYSVIPESLVIQRIRAGSHSSDLRTVWVAASHSVRQLGEELPAHYRPDLSDAAARFATRLFEMGARTEARAAARLARELGKPGFRDRPFHYRVVARLLGQELAEELGRAYRRLVAPGVRRLFHG